MQFNQLPKLRVASSSLVARFNTKLQAFSGRFGVPFFFLVRCMRGMDCISGVKVDEKPEAFSSGSPGWANWSSALCPHPHRVPSCFVLSRKLVIQAGQRPGERPLLRPLNQRADVPVVLRHGRLLGRPPVAGAQEHVGPVTEQQFDEEEVAVEGGEHQRRVAVGVAGVHVRTLLQQRDGLRQIALERRVHEGRATGYRRI